MRSSIHPISTYPKRSEGRKLSKMKEETFPEWDIHVSGFKRPTEKIPKFR